MKKFGGYQKYFKNVIKLFVISIMFLLTMENVSASTLTIDSVSSQFNNSDLVQGLASFQITVKSSVDSTNKTLDIYSDGEKVFSFNYGDDYIEYDNRSAIVTEENWDDDIFIAACLEGIIDSVIKLSGYENKTISNYTVNNYDTYGIQLEAEDYSFSSTDQDGSITNTSGSHIKYFKISLDTEKIDALMANYGVDAEEQDPNKELINSLTPTLEVKNITENSVTLYPSIPYTNTDPNYTVNCYIYRSNSENGTYEKISDWAVNCLDSVGITDNNLKSGTTYYYKTMVYGGTKFSDIITVTTKSSISIDNNISSDEDQIENPNTGDNIKYVIISLGLVLAVISICGYKLKKKYN